jgi:hypothetical protein
VTPTRARCLAGLALTATVLLTGCGTVPDFNPGVAARVGDDTVTSDEVDAVAADYCGAAEQQLQEGQVLPNHYLRGEVAAGLALRAAADQLLEEYDVRIGREYDRAVARAEKSLASLDEDQRDALIEVQGASLYVSAVERAVGKAIIAEQGTTLSDRKEAADTAGEKAFVAWLDERDVRLDPKYGVSIESGAAAVSDTSLSFALGDTATKAGAEQPDIDYAAALPDTQRCG